jgi:hypothetical protein
MTTVMTMGVAHDAPPHALLTRTFHRSTAVPATVPS